MSKDRVLKFYHNRPKAGLIALDYRFEFLSVKYSHRFASHCYYLTVPHDLTVKYGLKDMYRGYSVMHCWRQVLNRAIKGSHKTEEQSPTDYVFCVLIGGTVQNLKFGSLLEASDNCA